MSRRTNTPYRPESGPLCEGLVIQVGTPDTAAEKARGIAQCVVDDTLRGHWEIEPLGISARDFIVVKPEGAQPLTVQHGWELTALLRDHRDVASAQPALIVPGISPAPEQVYTEEEQDAISAELSADPLPCSQDPAWSLKQCSVLQAWALEPPAGGKSFGEGIVIGHPDTGYTEHPEIWDRSRLLVDQGYDFEKGEPDPRDELVGMNPGHGTSTASVIMSAVAPPDGSGVIGGSAPQVSLVPLRVSTSVIHLSYRKLTEAIAFATKHGHHVISMSLGGPFSSDFLHRAMQHAVDQGVILFAAAGNYWPSVAYPAAFDEVIAVAACNCAREPWTSSAAGPAVDVTAGGESVWVASTKGEGDFSEVQSSGTSYAVATAAGTCALWLAYHGRDHLIDRYGLGNLASVFKEILITRGVDTPDDWDRRRYGAGMLNARKVLEAPLPETAPAGGMNSLHAGLVPTTAGDADLLAGYFPTVLPSTTYRTLAAILQTNEHELGAVLSVYGEEMRFHIATNPKVRGIITQFASDRLPEGLTVRAGLAANDRFVHNASRALQRRIFDDAS